MEVSFQDIDDDNGSAVRVLRQGYTLPVVRVNGRTILTGNLDYQWIYDHIRRLVDRPAPPSRL